MLCLGKEANALVHSFLVIDGRCAFSISVVAVNLYVWRSVCSFETDKMVIFLAWLNIIF
jgi:hypothetical protein